MATSKARLEQLGRMKERLNTMRVRTRHAAEQAGIGPKDVSRLIAQTRLRRAKSSRCPHFQPLEAYLISRNPHPHT